MKLVDIHTHVLHNIDDGAKDLNMAVEMCRTASQNNTEVIVGTPHFYEYRDIDAFLDRRTLRITELQKKLAEEKIPLTLLAGAEVALRDAVLRFTKLQSLAINGGRYLLCEFPFEPTPAERLVDYMRCVFDAGLIPILAHPERYRYIQEDPTVLNTLADLGVLFQITVSSPLGAFGAHAQALSLLMLRARMVECFASDGHHPYGRREVDLLKPMLSLSNSLSGDYLKMLLTVLPMRIVENQDIDIFHRGRIS